MSTQIFAVSQINQYLKQKLDADPLLDHLLLRGEISNYKVYPSGHHYFTLKDAEGALRCVMFRGSAMHLRFRPENGMKVIAGGKISVFPRDGAYQLYCTSLTPDGAGDLHVAFEQLRQRLEQEGLFDPQHKKRLPAYPHRIALITSSAGAAVHDMLRILGKRYPLSQVLLMPVRVQGVEAPPEIAGAIAYANRYALADVLIVGRGGGSMEDLWAFNEEIVARAIYASQIPVVSAVGHEPDVTISDYVADLRAATPSNAAELVAPDQQKLRQRLAQAQSLLAACVTRKLALEKNRLTLLSNRRCLQSPINIVDDRRLLLDHLFGQLNATMQNRLSVQRRQFIALAAKLDALSPLKVLTRGYSMVHNEHGAIVKSCADVTQGQTLRIRLCDGTIDAQVVAIQEEQP